MLPHTKQSEYNYHQLMQTMANTGNLLFAHHHSCPLPDFDYADNLLNSAFLSLANNKKNSIYVRHANTRQKTISPAQGQG